jgi:shikimate dehydrogenase
VTPVPATGRRAAVLGHPIAHSLSPALHRAAYAALGLDLWRYDVIDVSEDQLAGFMASLTGEWAGLSLTMPLKQTVIPLLDHIEPLAEVVGAVNTVLVQAGRGRPVLTGANTDVYGIVAALGEALAPDGGPVPSVRRTAAVLGGGATAASTLAALAQLGCTTPVVYVRSLGRLGGLMRAAHRMGVEPRYASLGAAAEEIASADLVISTLPPHAADALATKLASVQRHDGSPRKVLLDAAYDPRPTVLAVAWERAGGVVVGGERMLLHQAAEQVRLMTGRPAPTEVMSAALDDALAHTAH